MKRISALFGLSIISILCIPPELAAQELVITHARIIDGNDGVIEQGSVVVRDGRIESVTTGTVSLPGVQTIDAKGMTVMPAFIDAHRHIITGDPDEWLAEESKRNMQEFLDAGFTTVLSAGDPMDQILELRRKINDGETTGPRLIVSGRVPLAERRGGFPPGVDPARLDVSRPPDRPTEAAIAIPHEQTRARVQELAKAGVDAIKTVIIVTPGGPEKETLAIIADEARRQGVISITHAVTVEDTVAAVEAGTHTLVHTPHIGMLDEETTRIIVDAGIPMTSTLGIFVPTFAESNAHIRDRTGIDNQPRFRDLDPFPMNTLSSAGQGPVNARLLWDAGITYGFGTDTRYLPRDTLAHELVPLRLVFSNKDIISIMTRNAAAAVGKSDELGTLEPGKLADIVILDGDPLEDIHAVLNVKTVIKEGKVLVDN